MIGQPSVTQANSSCGKKNCEKIQHTLDGAGNHREEEGAHEEGDVKTPEKRGEQ